MHHHPAAAAEPPLQALSKQLQPLGLAHLADAHVLHPGQRREQLLRALLTRLLGGASVDAISVDSSAEALEGLAQDERFAEKCHSLLQLLGISATPEQLRGCSSSNQEQSIAPLRAMAQLLQAMERQQQASSSSSSSSRPDAQAPAGSHALRVTQLLSCAAANLPKLTADSMQLFPSDMNDTLRAYSDQGALMHLPQLCQQAGSRVQQLQQQLQAMLGAGGGASCEAAGSAAWQGLVGEVSGALDRLLSDVAAFDAMYEQELSVWASVKGQQQQQQQQALPCSPAAPGSAVSSQPVAEAMGRMARSLVAGYQELTGVMAAFEAIRSQHTALKDVPVSCLQELRLQLADTRQHFRIAADATAVAAGASVWGHGGRHQ